MERIETSAGQAFPFKMKLYLLCHEPLNNKYDYTMAWLPASQALIDMRDGSFMKGDVMQKWCK